MDAGREGDAAVNRFINTQDIGENGLKACAGRWQEKNRAEGKKVGAARPTPRGERSLTGHEKKNR